jgi:hypothetical protein
LKEKIMRFLLLFIGLWMCPTAHSQARVVHVVVALCDNVNQGIVPVPAKIGNGQDPANNLYWGCAFGVKTFFKKQPDWRLLKTIANPSADIYERLVFKHRDSMVYLVADAYNGAMIKQATFDLLHYAAGYAKLELKIDSSTVRFGGSADVIAYLGHNGLMDFQLSNLPKATDTKQRQVVILACASKPYFAAGIKKAGAYPLLWTTNLMCPEAYTLHASVNAWVKHQSPETMRTKAAEAYHLYQKCGIKGARNLLVTGFE